MFLSAGGVFLLIRLLAKPYSLTKGNQYAHHFKSIRLNSLIPKLLHF